MTSSDNNCGDDGTSVQNRKDAETGHNDENGLQKETFFKKFGGMLMALGASFFFSVSFLIVKILGNHGFKAFGCSVLFNLGVLVPCLIGILLHEKGPKSHERSRIFREIWPLSISDKSTTLKILVVSVCPCVWLHYLFFLICFFFCFNFVASRNITRFIGFVTQFQSPVHDHW